MRYVLTIVEQLDRAARELETDHPINNRLALILIDNATELMVHRQCTDRLECDSKASSLWKAHEALAHRRSQGDQFEFYKDLRNDMLTSRQRSQAKGKSLDGKLRVLQDMGDLTPTERRFIKIAHDYRNDLYHVGLTHDEIMRAVAGQYFLLSCVLLDRLGNLGLCGISFSSNDEYTDVARRYLLTRGDRIDVSHVDKGMLAEKLRCTLPGELPSLASTLAGSARKSIEAVMDDFGFLIEDNPFGFDADRILEVAQWQGDLAGALEREGINGVWVDPSYRTSYAAIATTLEGTWTQRHTSVPSEKWMLRADAIEREVDPMVAMDSYQSLRNDMSYLEESFETAALELDRWIQQETDMARGK